MKNIDHAASARRNTNIKLISALIQKIRVLNFDLFEGTNALFAGTIALFAGTTALFAGTTALFAGTIALFAGTIVLHNASRMSEKY